ncbi:hypothetical protein Ocin01_15202 [Orchesella cincta]|uniref:Uncharacterized protein n=1 Tax=Orchesella cincta TaxID=48709 RepID=A0A1D2MER2_ORCCI|nr:hypothetical protein Ocin01_15202 [Orchesella cincta]
MAFVSIALFLLGSTWWIELGGLQKEEVQYLKTTLHQGQLDTKEYLGRQVVRFKVDIPNSDKAPPLAAVAPLLNALSNIGYTLLSHNDEYKPSKDMVYLTWMLQKEPVISDQQYATP